MQLSPNFSLAQMTYSETAERDGIDNMPPEEILGNLRRLALGLEEVQELLGAPLEISSAYRCAALNAAVGGSATSRHMLGQAADIACPAFGSAIDVAYAIQGSSIAFDQCILEYGRWVHLSFGDLPRRRLLTIYDDGQGYVAGLWDRTGTQLA